ncbi:MAG: hypothetical protein NVSMB44_04660 [Ktedonobacteraceae bacterium]
MGETLNIAFHTCEDNSYEVRIWESWTGQTTRGKFIPPYKARRVNALQKKLEKMESTDQELRDIGYRLYTALCGVETSQSFSKKAPEQSVQAVLQNVIQRTLRRRGTVALALIFGTGCDEFMRYPWELLHNDDHFLIISGVFTLSRSLQRPDAPVGCELPVQPPFRILHIGASPSDYAPLETERSFDAMQQGLASLVETGQVLIDRLEPPTFSQLVRYFSLYGGTGILDDSDTTMPCYVIHFDGHGAYGRLCPKDGCVTMNDPGAKRCSDCGTPLGRVEPQTYLCFCDEDGLNCFVDTQSLRRLLVSSDIRLAVFAACETALVTNTRSQQRQLRTAVDATLATALVTAQVPVVVAMPFSLQDDLSPTFMYHFYESLATGRTIEESLSRARQAMLSTTQRSWFIPVLYRLVAEGEEAPVALIPSPDGRDEHTHPLAHLSPSTTFVGRERELRDMDALLAAAVSEPRPDAPARQAVRVGCNRIALTGYAGMGKSALAYEAIRRNRDKFPGGIIGVSLRDGKPFGDALIEMIHLLHISVRNVAATDVKYRARVVQSTLRSLGGRELPCLLLLDSFEEVKDHAELEIWLQFLCTLPQDITVIVTSRSNPENMAVVEGSRCRWYEYPVGKMTNADLLRLFMELAATSGLDQRIQLENAQQQAVLREICTLLDGYPLGAELIFGTARTIDGKIYTPEAATRSLEEVRDELRNTPLAGIGAVLDVSYRHLTPPACLLLSYLAAFKLPFTHAQISMLVAPEILAMAPETLVATQEIAQLVKKAVETREGATAELVKQWRAARDELVRASFMQFVDGHLYSIHSQTRQFALSHLSLEERRRIHRVVAAYYSSLPKPSADEWFEALEHLEAAAEPRDLQEAIRVAVRAAYALEGSGHVRELQTMLRRASGYALHSGDTTGEAEIQCRLGVVLRLLGQYAEAEVCFKSSSAIHREASECELAARALYELMVLYCEIGDFQQAQVHTSEALALFREINSARGEACVHMVLGQISHGYGSYYEAQGHFDHALTSFVNVRDQAGRALTLSQRGKTFEALGEYEKALHDFEEALRLFNELKRPLDQGWVHVYKSIIYVHQGKLDLATTTCKETLTQFNELGIQRGEAWVLRVMGDICWEKKDFILARSYYERASALFISVGDKVGWATVLNALGRLSLAENEALNARSYYEQARAVAQVYGAKHTYACAVRGLGDVESTLKQFGEAEEKYREALKIFLEIDTSTERALLLYHLGTLYEAEQKYREALEIWVQALSLRQYLGQKVISEIQRNVDLLVGMQQLEDVYKEVCAHCGVPTA